MTREEIIDLAKRVEALTGPDREVDGGIAAALKIGNNLPDWAARWDGEWKPTIQGAVVLMQADGNPGPHFSSLPYTASLDAAMQLVPMGCIHMVRTLWHDDKTAGNATVSRYKQEGNGIFWQDNYAATAATPALALTAAALRAIAEGMEP
jgi:hypothetical protein